MRSRTPSGERDLTGVGGRSPGRSLKPGGLVELEVENIGVLRNTIGMPAAIG